MKRQEKPLSLSSSSSTRWETSPSNHQAKSIGCMSGLFHLVTKYQQRRKFLTSARKQDRDSTTSPNIPNPSLEKKVHEKTTTNVKEEAIRSFAKFPPPECDFRRFSCEVPRSPTLPQEDGVSVKIEGSVDLKILMNPALRSPTLPTDDITRSTSLNSPKNFRRPHKLVAQLMGLDEKISMEPQESASDKRQKLLGALEKCDEDLKELRKIIEDIRLSEHFQSPTPPANVIASTGMNRGSISPRSMKACIESKFKVQASTGAKSRVLFQLDGRDSMIKDKSSSDYNAEQQSLVSVSDEIISPPFLYNRKKNGEHKKSKEENSSFSSFHRITAESLPRLYSRRGDYGSQYFWLPPKKPDWVSPFSSSRAMIVSVNEVCQEVNWGEKRELGRIGLAIQDHICAGLIEEIVRELVACCSLYSSLPFEACRKRLSF